MERKCSLAYKLLFYDQIHLKRKALLTARGSGAGGGVVQLRSDVDVDGLCESKFNVTGKTFGLVNILGEYKKTKSRNIHRRGTAILAIADKRPDQIQVLTGFGPVPPDTRCER